MKLKLFTVFSFILIVGCAEKPTLNSQLNVTTYIHSVKNAIDTISLNSSGYLFLVDSSTFRVASYKEAAAGIIRSKADSTITKTYDDAATINPDGTLEFKNLKSTPLFFVIYNTSTKVYAWRQLDLQPGVANVSTRIRFRTWKETPTTYNEAGWTVVLE